MDKTKIFFNALFISISLIFSVVAQASSGKIDTVQIKEVVVTGTLVKVNRNNVPMAVTVVNRTQIEETDETALLPILNGRVPGLFVTERGITGFGVAQGSAGQISIRGIGGNPTTGVLMLIDGHPQFMGIFGHPLPDSYVTSDVERVEVIRGPASILYGSNAMGGVINIITKKQTKEGIHGNGRLSYGSFNTKKYMTSAGFKKNKLSGFVSANHDQTDGHRIHSDFKINNGYAKLAYQINSHFYASTDVSLAAFKAADPGPDTLNASPGQSIDISRGYWAFSLQNEFEKSSGTFKFFYNFGEHNITDGFHSTDYNYGLNFFESLHLFKGNSISAGIDCLKYGGLAENLKARGGEGVLFADTSINETGIYFFVQQTLAESLTLNAGLRFQNHSVYGNQWIPSIGFAYSLNHSTTWKGTISKGFRSPTMRELFLWGPNPNLQPEIIINYETGVSKIFFNNKLNAGITFFAITGDSLIVNIPLQGFKNTGTIANKGMELVLNAEASKRLGFNATYSFIHMKNPVFATPEQHLYLNVHYRIKKLQLSTSVQQIINLDNDPSPVVNKENYTLLQAKAMYKLTKNFKLFVSGHNLFNQSYQVNRYYTMPGATILSGVNFKF
ncbi:MAG: TonB-dependent receptor [Prolixibacteraceae bacterium]|nr:TonB-dependent receptor [Prolixibacteraceae bacterium]